MNLIPLKKDEIKQLELVTYRVENCYNNMASDTYKKCWQYMMGIQTWHDAQHISVNDTQKKLNNKLSQLLNNKPAYYVNYEYRNAVWGFYWDTGKENTENNKFLIYHDRRGLSIQLHKQFRKDMAEQFLQELFDVLVDKNNLSETEKQILKDII
jgi:hypothetical protein